MGDIEWLRDESGRPGRTWNPAVGCQAASEGCLNCWAARMAATRLRHLPDYAGLAELRHNEPRWCAGPRLLPHRLAQPLGWQKARRIFVCDMGDLFHDAVPNEYIAAVFGVMAACQQHTFCVLTKRPARMRRWFDWVWSQQYGADRSCQRHAWAHMGDALPMHRTLGTLKCYPWPLPNVWLGTSVEHQEAADERVPELLQCPAAVRFVSAEPLLGSVRLAGWMYGLHWVIVGGEAGPEARPMSVGWARWLRDECSITGVKFFYKQRLDNGRKISMPELDGRVWAEVP